MGPYKAGAVALVTSDKEAAVKAFEGRTIVDSTHAFASWDDGMESYLGKKLILLSNYKGELLLS